jgi:hypothetical protein
MAKQTKKPMDEDALKNFVPDYPPEVCERRMNETLRRCMGMPATYNLDDDDQYLLTPAEKLKIYGRAGNGDD